MMLGNAEKGVDDYSMPTDKVGTISMISYITIFFFFLV